MKKTLLLCCCFSLFVQVFAQDVKLLVYGFSNGITFNRYETITGLFEVVNTTSTDISVCRQPIYRVEYMNSKNKWTNIMKGIISITPEYECRFNIIRPNEKLKRALSCKLMHPNFNSFIQPDLEYNPNTVILRIVADYYQENVLKYAYSEPFTVQVNPLNQEDSSYSKWLNERHIFGFWARDINIEAYERNKTQWQGSPETNPALYHNFTSGEIEEAMVLFPKSILLGLNLSRAIYSPIDGQLHMPRELLIKILIHIGKLNDTNLIQEHKYRVLSICGGNEKDHTCEAYKTLAPLYGLPD